MTLEDVALCAAWCESKGETLADQASRIQALEARWAAEHEPPATLFEGGRQQPLLRKLIDELRAGSLARLARDELDFLCIAYELMGRAARPEEFARPRSCIEPHIEAIIQRRAELPVAPGLPALEHRVTLVLPRELEAAPVRRLTAFAGMALPFTGHVLQHWGTVRIVGDVPEDCAVAVEEGDCYVGGYVLGHVAATFCCEVCRNVSGAVVVRRGDVSLRDIIDHALVVSKHGSVRCRASRRPRLVFAQQQFLARTCVAGGLYFAAAVQVQGEVFGGTLHIAGTGRASRFRCDPEHALMIVLRRGLNHGDYGERMPEDALRLLLRARMLRRRAKDLRDMTAMARRESEHFARNALLFLSGGDRVTASVERLETAERRLAFLDRVIAGMESMMERLDERLNARKLSEERQPVDEADDTTLEALRRELQSLECEGGIDEELARKRDEVLKLQHDLRDRRSELGEALALLRGLLERVSAWQNERQTLAGSIEAMRAEVQQGIGRVAVLDRAGNGLPGLKILQQVLTAAREEPAASPVAARLRHPFMKLMLRNIEQHGNRVRAFAATLRETCDEYADAARVLQTEHHVQLPGAASGEEEPGGRVTGAFDAGVRIYADLRAFETDAPEGRGRVTTAASADSVTYRLGHAGTVERA